MPYRPGFDAKLARERHPEWEEQFRTEFRKESCEALAGELAILTEQALINGVDMLSGVMTGAITGLTPEGFDNLGQSFGLYASSVFVLETLVDVMIEKCGSDFRKIGKMILTVGEEAKRQYAESLRGIKP